MEPAAFFSILMALGGFGAGLVTIFNEYLTKDTVKISISCRAWCRECSGKRYKMWITTKSYFVIKILLLFVAAGLAGGYLATGETFSKEYKTGVSALTVNIFGTAISEGNESNIWDSTDLAQPPIDTTMFFITTKIVTTSNQTRDECPEQQSVVDARCSNDFDCEPKGKAFNFGRGFSNGTCSNNTSTCFVKAWCPIEDDRAAHSEHVPENSRVEIINGTDNFIILVKNHVLWEFGDGTVYQAYNMASQDQHPSNKTHINDKENPFSPYFRLGNILETLDNSKDLKSNGGVVSIRITWKCDARREINDCNPEYNFRRLDKGDEGTPWRASGYNYTDTIYSYEDHHARHLTRSVGILFIVVVDPVAYQPSASLMIIQLGSVLALTGIAPAAAQLIFMLISVCIEPKGPDKGNTGASNGHELSDIRNNRIDNQQ